MLFGLGVAGEPLGLGVAPFGAIGGGDVRSRNTGPGLPGAAFVGSVFGVGVAFALLADVGGTS